MKAVALSRPWEVKFTALPPLALYVHLPWCERKCPYCDFNSHELGGALPEPVYVDTLAADLEALLPSVWGRRIASVFIGGGTPSLFAPESIDRLLSAVRARIPVEPEAEVTLEANPGSAEAGRLRGYREAGVNRLSLGIQSFDDRMLKALGRIHSAQEARRAIEMAQAAFDNLNLDLMYGLPEQTPAMAQADMREALRWQSAHLSAYQLTIEPNTVFWSKPPALPDHDAGADMQLAIEDLLGAGGYEHYETSAFARPGRRCRHNLNYWEYGDYLGLGAGAHGKLSFADRVARHERAKSPREHMSAGGTVAQRTIEPRELPFEFMLNAARLVEGFAAELFPARTGLALSALEPGLRAAEGRGLVERDLRRVRPTTRGQRFLNELQQLFVP
ncbi:MAG: oxygen-independent coproporphyrinogen III oxidase-like protein [Betaproteobacteria bacterium]|nr:oxygen-independent coproporphyrinogen III oxidase-like protein [Betaproteobacteria bacterium]